MQSRNLLNILLLLAVTGLSATVWFVHQDKTEIHYLSSLDATQVNRIVIPREQGEIVLTRQAGHWNMEKPYALPAHEFRVQSLLGLLQTPVSQSYAAEELDLAQFDLNPPRARILFNDQEIRFGKSSPVSNQRYVLHANRIYLLDDRLYPLISAEAASLINLSPLPEPALIEKIILPDLTLQKDAGNNWHDANGNIIAADTAQQLLENWRDAIAFGAHAYMERTDAKPVTIESKNKMMLQFLASQENDWLILGRPDAGVEYHFDAQYRDKLLVLPTARTGH
ncbi:MAG: hypothetical protein QG652_1395, partial [Pseudomonadota bacterium]|nr:hypothetical protein [Pseudomonadota bacterium]